jgi:hypothetical protein
MALRDLIQRLLGRQPKTQLPPFNFARNRYPAKKKWPPNLKELTERQQFRFERKYKRRLRMKSLRPVWNKWVTIVQWTLIGGISVYSILFHDFAQDPMNPRPGEQPFKGLRNYLKGLTKGFWTHTMEEVEETASTKGEEEAAVEEAVVGSRQGAMVAAGGRQADRRWEQAGDAHSRGRPLN